MSRLVKVLARKPAVQRRLAAAATRLIRAVNATTRWQTVNSAVPMPAWAGQQPVIVAFWHNRLAMMPYCWPSPEPFNMLISPHPDGRLIADAVGPFGIKAIAGSTTHGGGEALRALLKRLKAGESVGITPDGPRGPRMRAGDGAITLARLSGAPILPAAVSVSRRYVLKTWDRLIIALPFGRGAMVWGDPIKVPRDAGDGDLDALRLRLEAGLNEATARADALAGHRPMEPAQARDRQDGADAAA